MAQTGILVPYTVRVKFPRDEDKDEFVHTFKFPGEVAFTYMPEDSTPGEWKEVKLHEGSEVNDPVMLEQAVRSMDKKDLAAWIEHNSDSQIKEAYIKSDSYLLQVIDRYENNYGQNTAYKSCVKDKWWTFWDGPSKNEECIKIKADGYSDYKPNFCYERKWDDTSITEVGLIAGEVALGVAVGILASPSGPGSIVILA